jgi:hypothetical protein
MAGTVAGRVLVIGILILAANCYTDDSGVWPFVLLAVLMAVLLVKVGSVARFIAENAYGKPRGNPIWGTRPEPEVDSIAMIWRFILSVTAVAMIAVSVLAVAGALPC